MLYCLLQPTYSSNHLELEAVCFLPGPHKLWSGFWLGGHRARPLWCGGVHSGDSQVSQPPLWPLPTLLPRTLPGQLVERPWWRLVAWAGLRTDGAQGSLEQPSGQGREARLPLWDWKPIFIC